MNVLSKSDNGILYSGKNERTIATSNNIEPLSNILSKKGGARILHRMSYKFLYCPSTNKIKQGCTKTYEVIKLRKLEGVIIYTKIQDNLKIYF